MVLLHFSKALERLSLSEADAARLLSVNPRTIRRWADAPEEIPGPAEQAIRAWLRLDELGLAWRPDGIAIGEDDPKEMSRQITLLREHAIELKSLLDRVKARDGPAAPWVVDLPKRMATLGAISITFYATRNGSFSPQSYTRSDDKGVDIKRDWSLIEDGFAAVASTIAKAGLHCSRGRRSSAWKDQAPTQNARR